MRSTRRLSAPRGKQSLSNVLRKTLSLSPAAIGLAQEVTQRQARRACAGRDGGIAESGAGDI